MAANAMAQETLCALRRDIARIEGRLAERLEPPTGTPVEAGIVLRRGAIAGPLLSTGAEHFDTALGGGLPLAALSEIHGKETRDAGAVAGFALALATTMLSGAKEKAPLLWITAGDGFREAGMPYAPGLLYRFGIAPEALLLSEIHKPEDALWVAEEAAALAAFSAIFLELRGSVRRLDLTATRRLHRRAQAAGRPFYLLRQAGWPEPTAAPVRLVVSPAPAGERRLLSGALAGSIGPPAFTVEIAKNSFSGPAQFTLEWNQDERAFHERPTAEHRAPHTGALVSAPSDRPDTEKKAGQVVAFRGAA
jgi:protein ImuA